MRRHPEDDLQEATARWCRLQIHKDVLYWHTPNGGRRTPQEAARFKAFGVLPGVPDWIFIWSAEHDSPASILFIELKSPVGRLSDEQRLFKGACGEMLIPYKVCKSLDEFMTAVRAAGVPCKYQRNTGI